VYKRQLLESPDTTWGEVFKNYPDFENLYNAILEIQNKDNDEQSKYSNTVFEYWESDIRKKLAA
jgi:hypothetical protein